MKSGPRMSVKMLGLPPACSYIQADTPPPELEQPEYMSLRQDRQAQE